MNTREGSSTLKCSTFLMLSYPESQLFISLLQQEAGSKRACGRYGSSTGITWSVLPVPLLLQFVSQPDLPGEPPGTGKCFKVGQFPRRNSSVPEDSFHGDPMFLL